MFLFSSSVFVNLHRCGGRAWRYGLAVVVIVGGCGAAVLAGVRHFETLYRREAAAALQERAYEIGTEIDSRIRLYTQLARGAAAFAAAAGNSDEDRWRSYVAALRLRSAYPAAVGIGFATAAGDRAPVTLFADGGPDRVPPPDFDLAGEPALKWAMTMARDGGAPVVSNAAAGTGRAMVLFAPVYRPGADTGTLAARRAALVGYAFVPVRPDALVGGIVGGMATAEGTGVSFRLYDGDAVAADRLLAGSRDAGGGKAGGLLLRRTVFLWVAGRALTLDVTERWAAFSIDRSSQMLTIGGGGALGALLLWLVLALMSTRLRARALAEDMTVAMQRREREARAQADHLQAVLDAIPSPLFFKDGGGRYSGFNHAFEEFFGEARESLVGKTVFDISPPGFAARYHEMDQRLFRNGGVQIYEAQVQDRRGDVHDVMFRKSLLHADDRVTMIGVVLDITEQNRAARRLVRLNDTLRLLNEINGLAHLAAAEKIRRALARGADHLGLAVGLIGRVQEDRLVVEYLAAPADSACREGAAIDFSGYAGSGLLESGEVHWRNGRDIGELPCLAPGGEGAVIGVPVDAGPGPVRILAFAAAAPRHEDFDYGDVELVRLMGRWAASVLAEDRMRRDLERLATSDPLTGLWNRRRFMDLAEGEIARAVRYRRAASVLMIDVDRFKSINDRHGHGAGDQALVAMAHACSAQLRAQDIFARLGGEEFAVLLPETGEAAAREVAERLRAAVAALRLPVGEETLAITISLGVAGMLPGETGVEAMLQRADRALYKAKALGRNRAETAPPAGLPANYA